MGAAARNISPLELKRLVLRRDSLARALRAWRAHRPFADRTLALERELREIDTLLSNFDRLRFQ